MEQQQVGFVIDTNAVLGPRFHDIIEGAGIKRYALNAHEATEMPMDHALKFLRDPAFIVKDSKGNVLKPLAKKDWATHVPMPDGFVLAEWEELSKEALYVRCKVLPNSEDIYPTKTPKAQMIAFLVAFEKNKNDKSVVNRPLGGMREIKKEVLDEMFENEAV